MTETGPTAFLAAPARCMGADRIGRQAAAAGRSPDRRARTGARSRTARSATCSSPGPAVTPGYWNDPEATRAAFTDDGWLRSGDLARRDCRRLLLGRRAAEGDVHLRRRERLSGRGRECARRAPGGGGGGGRRRARPALGRGRIAPSSGSPRGRQGRPRPSSTPSAGPGSPPIRCRRASKSWRIFRAPPRARCRSIGWSGRGRIGARDRRGLNGLSVIPGLTRDP